MDAAQRDELGSSDVVVWDTERPYHFARWTHDHRLLPGGGDRVVKPGQPAAGSSKARHGEVTSSASFPRWPPWTLNRRGKVCVP